MTDLECDVLVIGTGPAGAISSYYAAEKGANVLVIDKKSEVGVPVRCGEGLPGTVLDDFEIKQSREWVANNPTTVKITSSKGQKVEVRPHVTVCVLHRDKFEQMLIGRAERKGARILLRTTALDAKRSKGRLVSVTLKREDEEDPVIVRPRVVVAADGVESRVGRWIGLDTKISLGDIGTCAQHTLEHEDIDADVMEFLFGIQGVNQGYSWVFPKGKGIGNVGLGMLPEKDDTPKEALDRFIDIRLKGAVSRGFTAGCVPACRPVKESVKGNVMLVGDAARQVIALTGAGVANAFIAGRIAGRIAGKVGNGKQDIEELHEYDKRWRKVLEKKLLKSYKYRTKLSSDKKLERYFRLVRLAMVFYKMAPNFFGPRMLGDFLYTGGDEE